MHLQKKKKNLSSVEKVEKKKLSGFRRKKQPK